MTGSENIAVLSPMGPMVYCRIISKGVLNTVMSMRREANRCGITMKRNQPLLSVKKPSWMEKHISIPEKTIQIWTLKRNLLKEV